MPEPKRQSLTCLDLVNFFQADTQTGVGPFLAVYLLATRHWDPGRIGIAMFAQGIAVVLAQTPAGAIVDAWRPKRMMIAIASLCVAAASIAIVHLDGLVTVVAAQVAVGISSVIIPLAITALTMGLVKRDGFARRMGRNEAFNHAGNVFGAALAGILSRLINQSAIFYFAAAMGAATAASSMAIRERDIDHRAAREAREDSAREDSNSSPQTASWREIFADRRIAIFAACVILFHFANAAMLPILGELLATTHHANSALYMSACIIVAQVVMTPVAIVSGRSAERWGRKRVLALGFAVLPIRGLLYTMVRNPYALVAIQILDGIGAGIFGVVSVIVVADLARDTGRFNFILGAINTGVSIGASVSNLMTGFIVKRSGYNFGFIVLAMIAAVALASLLFAMPETKDTGDEPKSMPSFERGPKGARSAAPQALPRRSKAESREN
ncbi:MAG TPA: MFS transporter [Candidatus Binataceae bacterium]|nr:MFS transporter [Candidatus Binataceae bacterium]